MAHVATSDSVLVDSPMGITDDPQAPSAFLQELPVEIRLQIYRHFFKGGDDPLTRSHLIWNADKQVFCPTHHRNLLLTCRTIRQEANELYFSSTVVDFQGIVAREGAEAWEAAHPPAAFAKLPAIAFQRTRRVRNVPIDHPACSGDDDAAIWHLRRFERLKWCRTAPVVLSITLPHLFTFENTSPLPCWTSRLQDRWDEQGESNVTLYVDWDIEVPDISKTFVSGTVTSLSRIYNCAPSRRGGGKRCMNGHHTDGLFI